MEKSGIFCKIDWFQAVFYDVDFDFVLNTFLELNISLDDAVTNSCYDRKYGCYDYQMVYDINGVTVSANYNSVVDAGSDCFRTVYQRVMLVIGGQGLDYLRSYYSDPDDLDRILRKQPMLNDADDDIWHVTRCDFAFDFVNYKYDIYSCCRDELDMLSYDGKIKVKGIKSPISYSVRSGSEETIYIGKPRSNRLVRIYNKKLEQTKDGVLKSVPDESINYDIDSWNRLELQCRNNWAVFYLYGSDDYMQILRSVYDYYAFTDREGHISDFWSNLFDWKLIPTIIQNANYTKVKLCEESLNNQANFAYDILCAFCAFYGLDWVIDKLKTRFESFFWEENYNTRKTRKLLKRIDCLNKFKNDNTSLKGAKVVNVDGRSILQLK